MKSSRKNLRLQSDSHDWQEMFSRSAREAWRVSPDISPRSFPSHLTRVGAVPIEFEARPTVDSRERCGGPTPESPCRSADGRSALSTSSANKDESLLDAI